MGNGNGWPLSIACSNIFEPAIIVVGEPGTDNTGESSRMNERQSVSDAGASAQRLGQVIILLRGQNVVLDADLASLYGVTTKRFNEQVKRNIERFPPDFMFRLTASEKAEVVANCDHLGRLKYSPTLPYAFTEHGAVMAANVLNSPVAVQASIHVVRAFVRLRTLISSHEDLARKLVALEKKYDKNFRVVFDTIRALMAPPVTKRRAIGFLATDGAEKDK